ncbi:hypothetical protein [uncultured Mucilaginibacter sp.]|uniref:hypothetical protein n=1 Tax=uncultured Mucilaginibacter sp. TaxID=797541 RepID=UPI0025D78804|nr:hypothetical protein [uncultured Mucilaginibacter sp.]
MTRHYHFPATRATLIGVILIFVSLLPLIIFSLIDKSIISGLKFYAELFTGFPQILLGLINLLIIISGVSYIIKSRKIVWLKLDDRGVYYLPWGDGAPSRAKPLFNIFYLEESLVFIPYRDVHFAKIRENKWTGGYIRLNLKGMEYKDIKSVPFTVVQKQEIIAIINEHCNKNQKST